MIKLSISNIAWGQSLSPDLLNAIRSAGCTGVELAPGLIDWGDDLSKAADLKERLNRSGLSCVGFHSLTYEYPKWRIVNKSHWIDMLNHLQKLCEYCRALNGRFLVYGSPPHDQLKILQKIEHSNFSLIFFIN